MKLMSLITFAFMCAATIGANAQTVLDTKNKEVTGYFSLDTDGTTFFSEDFLGQWDSYYILDEGRPGIIDEMREFFKLNPLSSGKCTIKYSHIYRTTGDTYIVKAISFKCE